MVECTDFLLNDRKESSQWSTRLRFLIVVDNDLPVMVIDRASKN